MPVPSVFPHRYIARGDIPVEKRKKHTLKHGNTVVHIVEPRPMTREDIEKVLNDFHQAGWAIVRDIAGVSRPPESLPQDSGST